MGSIADLFPQYRPDAAQSERGPIETRFSRCAQVIAMDGMYAGFAGAKTGHRRVTLCWRDCFCISDLLQLLATPGRCDQSTPSVVRAGRGRRDSG